MEKRADKLLDAGTDYMPDAPGRAVSQTQQLRQYGRRPPAADGVPPDGRTWVSQWLRILPTAPGRAGTLDGEAVLANCYCPRHAVRHWARKKGVEALISAPFQPDRQWQLSAAVGTVDPLPARASQQQLGDIRSTAPDNPAAQDLVRE